MYIFIGRMVTIWVKIVKFYISILKESNNYKLILIINLNLNTSCFVSSEIQSSVSIITTSWAYLSKLGGSNIYASKGEKIIEKSSVTCCIIPLNQSTDSTDRRRHHLDRINKEIFFFVQMLR